MSVARRVGFSLAGLLSGLVVGGLLGLGGGLAYTTLAGTSSFEGFSGYVVAFWILGGMLFGMIAGLITGIRLGRR
jgi:hypothetical protein